jgi:hypothetical protein
MIVQFPSSISELNASLADVKMADLMRQYDQFHNWYNKLDAALKL